MLLSKYKGSWQRKLTLAILLIGHTSHMSGAQWEGSWQIRERTYVLPGSRLSIDWAWNEALIVSSEGTSLAAFKFEENELGVLPLLSSIGAKYPTFLRTNRICYIRNDGFLIIADMTGDTAVRSRKISKLGLIGQLSYEHHAVFIHSVNEQADPPDSSIYRIQEDSLKVDRITNGYYPCTLDGQTIYYVDDQNSYTVSSIQINERGEPISGSKRAVGGSDVFALRAARGAKMLICQRGTDKPIVQVLDLQGRVRQILSKPEEAAYWPLVSPSGRLVAYSSRQGGAGSLTVTVVTIEGERIKDIDAGRSPMGSAYRWAFGADELGVVYDNGMGIRELRTIRFSPTAQ